MKKQIFTLLCVLFAFNVIQAQQLKPFKQGDRIAFVGNSITDGGHYHSYIWLYYMTRFPYMRVRMGNLGIGGDTSAEILNRLEADVFAKNPTVVALTFGMNDSGYFELLSDTAQTFKKHRLEMVRKNYDGMEKILKKHGVRVIQIGTSPYDEYAKLKSNLYHGKNDFIRDMIAIQEISAKKNGWEFLDFNKPMTDMNRKRQKADSAFTICGHDRIHPDNDGHMVMAYIFLKAQGLADKCVADIEIDATKKQTISSENCSVYRLKANDGEVEFDYLANSLPYPLDTIARGGMEFKRPQSRVVEHIPGFMENMNFEGLKISNLKGNYEFKIDGEIIDTLSADQLSNGINMAQYSNTPQYRQAKTIMVLNEDRWEMERRMRDWAWVEYDYFLKNGMTDVLSEDAEQMYDRDKKGNWWLASRRDIYARMGNKGVQEACKKYMDVVVDEIYRLNKPKTHHISLKLIH